MPKSRVKDKSKRRPADYMTADARRKTRRWTFRVDVTGGAYDKSFIPPGLTIGDNQDAQTASNQLAKEISEMAQFEKYAVKVISLAHEVVSPEILQQMNGLNKQGQTLASALRIAVIELVSRDLTADDVELDKVSLDKKVEERMITIVAAVTAADHRQELIDAGLDPDNLPQTATEVPSEYSAAAPDSLEALSEAA